MVLENRKHSSPDCPEVSGENPFYFFFKNKKIEMESRKQLLKKQLI